MSSPLFFVEWCCMTSRQTEKKKKKRCEERKAGRWEGGKAGKRKAEGGGGGGSVFQKPCGSAMPLRRLSAVHFSFGYGNIDFSRSRGRTFVIGPPGVDQASGIAASHKYDHSYMHAAMHTYA